MVARQGKDPKQVQKENLIRYSVPFLVLWFAVSLGALSTLWPYASTTVCEKPLSQSVASIFHDASFWTGEEKAYGTSMAVLDNGRIACTGRLEEVRKIADPDTEFISLGGRFVTPGLIDPHIHVLSGGLSLHTPDLSEVQSIQELKDIMRTACESAGKNDWVQGIGWNEVTWGGPDPHKSWLDEVCPHQPVVLHRMCWHKVVISSHTAKLVGLSEKSKDPPGGRIYRDSKGITGLLAESAMDIVKLKIPALSIDTKSKLVKETSQYLLSQGVTMAHDMGTVPPNESEAFENLEEVYKHLADTGQLPIRLFAFTPLSGWKRLANLVQTNGTSHSSMHLFWGGLKEFADGSLGSQTALFHEPYLRKEGEAETRGVRTIEKDELQKLVVQADRENLQVAVHAIGDLAVDDVLDVFENAESQNEGSRKGMKPRHRIEHAQHLSSPAVAQRFADGQISAVVNPLHLLPDKRVLNDRLGENRAGKGHSYAFNTMLQAGARLSFSSDFPVVKSDPLLGIFAAFFRRNLQETEPFTEEESVSLEAGLRASTLEAARLAGLENDLGTLRKGKLADFVVLSSDPLHMDPEFGLPKVSATYVGGKLAYRNEIPSHASSYE